LSISREFEKLPKATFIAMKEMYDGRLTFKYPDEMDDENEIM
jgi:hypothetical protein